MNMWIKTLKDGFLVNCDNAKAIGICPEDTIQGSGTGVVEKRYRVLTFGEKGKEAILGDYINEADAVCSINMIAKAITNNKILFEMPTQEQIDNGDFDNALISAENTENNERELVKYAMDLWNTLESDGYKPVKRVIPGKSKYKMILARLKEYSKEEYAEVIESIRKSSYLKQNQDKWFDFDWLMHPNNFEKVYNGKYNSAEDRLDEEQVKWWVE
jgi:hypothetical protein